MTALHDLLAPSSPSNASIESMSASRGTLERNSGSAVSRLPARIGRAAFFAPLIGIDPVSRLPPWILILSINLSRSSPRNHGWPHIRCFLLLNGTLPDNPATRAQAGATLSPSPGPTTGRASHRRNAPAPEPSGGEGCCAVRQRAAPHDPLPGSPVRPLPCCVAVQTPRRSGPLRPIPTLRHALRSAVNPLGPLARGRVPVAVSAPGRRALAAVAQG